jgi:general secretion pathway protein D
LVLVSSAVSAASRVSVDARDTDIADVVQQLSAQAQFDVVIGPGVKGKVTLFVSDVEVGDALEALAAAGGWAVYRSGGVYRFVSREEYERSTGLKFAAEMRTEVFTVRSGSATSLAASLASLSSPGGKVVVDPEGASVMVFDRPLVIGQMRSLIESGGAAHETALLEVRWIGPEDAARRVKDVLGPTGAVQADAWRSRLVVRDDPRRVALVKELLDSLDVPPVHAPAFVALDYVDADSIGNLVDRLQAMQPGRVVTPIGGDGLLIEDSPAGLEDARSLLVQVDSPRATIRVDARILQVSVSREVETGIDWQAIADKVDGLVLRGSFPMASSGPRLEGELGDIADDDYEVLFSMLESFGRVELIARPTLLTHSGDEAELMVGSKVPYVTVDSREDNGGTVSRYQRVTYLPVGFSIWVRPRLHRDGTVSLAIRPEISSITDYVEAGDTRYPVVETANAQLAVTVPLGRSVVIGGLIRDTKARTSSGVPLLRSIPVLGALFRHQVDTTKRAELVMVLTPTIPSPAEE